MEKMFELNGCEYTVKPCTAIAGCDESQESARQNALFVRSTADSGENFDYVVFGWEMPADPEAFADMCEDSNAWESEWQTLQTVRF